MKRTGDTVQAKYGGGLMPSRVGTRDEEADIAKIQGHEFGGERPAKRRGKGSVGGALGGEKGEGGMSVFSTRQLLWQL